MLKIQNADVEEQNAKFSEATRRGREDNMQWLKRNLPRNANTTTIVLVGGPSGADFRLRVAQSHLRHDLTPSHWSHAMLITGLAQTLGQTEVVEISLTPPNGFDRPVETNAIQIGRIDAYRSKERFPNIAVISIPVEPVKIQRSLSRYKAQRAVLDTVELLVIWLSFAWGVGRTSNPLFDGNGIPSAAMIEVVVSSSGYELTPGLASRASCPEAIWQSARWWHKFYEREKQESLSGKWCVEHYLA